MNNNNGVSSQYNLTYVPIYIPHSSSQEGGHLDFDTKDDVEKPSTDF